MTEMVVRHYEPVYELSHNNLRLVYSESTPNGDICTPKKLLLENYFDHRLQLLSILLADLCGKKQSYTTNESDLNRDRLVFCHFRLP